MKGTRSCEVLAHPSADNHTNKQQTHESPVSIHISNMHHMSPLAEVTDRLYTAMNFATNASKWKMAYSTAATTTQKKQMEQGEETKTINIER